MCMCVYSMAGNLHEKANNTFSASCPLWSGKKRFVVAARPRQKNLSENVAFVVDLQYVVVPVARLKLVSANASTRLDAQPCSSAM